jgi:hypothetical protein
LIMAGLSADQGASSQLIQQKLTQFLEILRQDPAVETAGGSTGGDAFAVLKPLSERNVPAQQVIRRLRLKLDEIAREFVIGGGARHSAWRVWEPISIHTPGRQHQRYLGLGAQSSRRFERRAALDGRHSRTAATWACGRSDHRPRHCGAARGHGQSDRSITPSTMRSANARCRLFMRRRTSTTLSWRWRPSSARTRKR